MKTLSKGLLTLPLVLVPLLSVAQYSFTATFHASGSGCGSAEALEWANSLLRGYPFSAPTKSECERVRSQVLSIKASIPGCSVYYTCTPCVGTDIGGNALNATSSNPMLNSGVEVRNSIDDYNYMRDVLTMQSTVDLIVVNSNADYSQTANSIILKAIEEQHESDVSLQLKQMIPNVENAIKSTALSLRELLGSGGVKNDVIAYLKNAFAELTGVDVSNYINKLEITYADQEIINSYHEFCDNVLARMQHDYANNPEYQYEPLEMAMYADWVYGDDEYHYYDLGGQPLRDITDIPNIAEREPAQKILDFLSQNKGVGDFQAEFYYDKDADKYILALRGSESFEDFIADGAYLSAGWSEQHNVADNLGRLIKDSGFPADKLTVTGHSLGGGLALLIGLKTGAETYAYDPLRLNDKAIQRYELPINRDDNIHCYTEDSELLVSGAEIVVPIAVKIGEAAKEKPNPDEVPLFEEHSIPASPVDVGNNTVVEIPLKGFLARRKENKSAIFNHSQKQMIEGIEDLDKDKTESYRAGRNRVWLVKKMRDERSYEQQLSSVRLVDAGGLEITTIKRQ